MHRDFWKALAPVVAMLMVLTISGCTKKRVDPGPYAAGSEETETLPRQSDTGGGDEARSGFAEESFSEQPAGGDLGSDGAARDPETVAREKFTGEDVYFDFDSSAIKPEAIDLLERKANWLLDNPAARVTIEGHCDERGTTEYNLALGDRRAEAVKSFLIDLGIAAARMTTVSYGEERPVAAGADEAAQALNRRAHFVVTD